MKCLESRMYPESIRRILKHKKRRAARVAFCVNEIDSKADSYHPSYRRSEFLLCLLSRIGKLLPDDQAYLFLNFRILLQLPKER